MTRTNLFYAAGKSETELFAYDEYDSQGSGIYFTDDAYMYERWNILDDAIAFAKEKNLNVYLVEITTSAPALLDLCHTITVELQWDKSTDAEGHLDEKPPFFAGNRLQA